VMPEGLLEKVELVSPGTKLRKALDDIVQANLGALLMFVDDPEKYRSIIQGGFEINDYFTPERLYELSKMDGATVISEDLSTIFRANAHLVPDSSIVTYETGMRHRTAERVAKQTGKMVIAISKRKSDINLYFGEHKYKLNDLRLLISRVTQAMSTMEKYRSGFDKFLNTITLKEFRSGVLITDISAMLDKGINLMKIYEEIYPYLIELGEEGKLAKMQVEEVMEDLEDTMILVVMDYCTTSEKPEDAKEIIDNLVSERDLTALKIARALNPEISNLAQATETTVYPRGYRVLKQISKIPLSVCANVVKTFGNLNEIASATPELLKQVEGIGEKRAIAIASSISLIKEKPISSNRVIQ